MTLPEEIFYLRLVRQDLAEVLNDPQLPDHLRKRLYDIYVTTPHNQHFTGVSNYQHGYVSGQMHITGNTISTPNKTIIQYQLNDHGTSTREGEIILFHDNYGYVLHPSTTSDTSSAPQ